MVPRTASAASPRTQLAIQLLRPHSRSSEWDVPGWCPGSRLQHPSRGCWYALRWLKGEDHGSAHSSLPSSHTHSTVSSLFLYSIFLSSSSTTPVQSTAHLDDCNSLPVGGPNFSPPSLDPVSSWKPALSFEKAKWPYQYLTYSPAISSNFSQFKVTKELELHLLGSAISFQYQIQQSTRSEERRELHFRPVLEKSYSHHTPVGNN